MIEWLDFFLNKSVENQKMCIFNKSIQKYEIFKDESIISSNGPLRWPLQKLLKIPNSTKCPRILMDIKTKATSK